MDKNKLAKLREVGYIIFPCCGNCEHGNFSSQSAQFGTCDITFYNHEKHTEAHRNMSVYRYGSCGNQPLMERCKAMEDALGAWGEFVLK